MSDQRIKNTQLDPCFDHGVCAVTLVSVCPGLCSTFGVSLGCVMRRQHGADLSVVLVVVLHHAFDVEQFVPQPAALFLLRLVI